MQSQARGLCHLTCSKLSKHRNSVWQIDPQGGISLWLVIILVNHVQFNIPKTETQQTRNPTPQCNHRPEAYATYHAQNYPSIGIQCGRSIPKVA